MECMDTDARELAHQLNNDLALALGLLYLLASEPDLSTAAHALAVDALAAVERAGHRIETFQRAQRACPVS
jgi:hypothetical protein